MNPQAGSASEPVGEKVEEGSVKSTGEAEEGAENDEVIASEEGADVVGDSFDIKVLPRLVETEVSGITEVETWVNVKGMKPIMRMLITLKCM
jgi:hypothetical protein